jgi:hypothetical protein
MFDENFLHVFLRFLEAEKKNSPLELRNAIKDLGLPDKSRLNSIKDGFSPKFEPKPKFLPMICFIYQNISSIANKPLGIHTSPYNQCGIMIQALELLQEFSQTDEVLQKMSNSMTGAEISSLRYLISESEDVVKGNREDEPDNLGPELLPAWNWFQKRATDPNCVCGLLFRLADMGVVIHPDVEESWACVTIDIEER